MMKLRISIIALGALCSILSGCGCSKEKSADGAPSRMDDAAYTNRLMELNGAQKRLAAQMADIRAKISRLGVEAKGTPEYAALTNRLVQCMEEASRIRKTTLNEIRTRVLKESAAQKGNWKK